MLAFENCQSFEKLVIDADIAGMAKQLSRGIQIRDDPIALDLIREVGHQSEFIIHDHTHRWFKDEFYYPSPIIDRQTTEEWERNGALTSWDRAKDQVNKLVAGYGEPTLDQSTRDEMRQITTRAAQNFGMAKLPPLPSLKFLASNPFSSLSPEMLIPGWISPIFLTPETSPGDTIIC
jgi:trimethylamine--corrinoid protein Co-methyltransferase